MIIIDYTDGRPIYEQIVERFQSLVLCGVLEKNEALPSVRNLAMELSINPNTIQRAYATLESQGYIYTVKGKGNFVSDKASLIKDYQKEISSQLNEICKQAASAGMDREEFMALVKESVAATGEWRSL